MSLWDKIWYHNHPLKWLLLPLSGLFAVLSLTRLACYKLRVLKQPRLPLPVVVIGNIGIGGNGKTPLVLYLADKLTKQGFRVGIVSRGYGSQLEQLPHLVTDNDSASLVGDEPKLLASRSGCPVVISPNRVKGVHKLAQLDCQIVLADDGLQHYRMARQVEIVVVDGKRQFGNGCLLPAGPLREGRWRLKSVDAVIANGQAIADTPARVMQLKSTAFVNVNSGAELTVEAFIKRYPQVNAIAGIGDPQRFFDHLLAEGFTIKQQQAFADHYDYVLEDIAHFDPQLPLLMTEKDAVKCQSFSQTHFWYLKVDATLSAEDEAWLLSTIITRCAHHGI